MQVVNFIPVPDVDTKAIICEIFSMLPNHLSFVCYSNECVCEIREKSLLFIMPADAYMIAERGGLYSLLRLGLSEIGTELNGHGRIMVVFRFKFSSINKSVIAAILKKNTSKVFGRSLFEILASDFLWISRYSENPYGL